MGTYSDSIRVFGPEENAIPPTAFYQGGIFEEQMK